MEQKIIYISTEHGRDAKMLSHSAEELEELIDNLNLAMVDFKDEDPTPFLNAIGVLTEIKMYAKSLK